VLQSPNPVLTAALFPGLLDNLLELLTGLGDEEWSKSTACPGWSVKDVALHLLGDEIGNLSSRRDGHSIHLASESWDKLVSSIDDWNREWLDAARRISSPLLIDLLELTGGQMAEYFGSLDPYSVGGSVSWVGEDPAPVWLDVAREYTERWHHQQHIRDAVNKPGLKDPHYLAPVLATFARALPRAFRHTEAAENTVATLTIAGESGGQWSVRREESIWQFYEGAPERPAAELVVNQDIAWRLFTRGLPPERGKELAAISGDENLGSRMLGMVSVIA
jgi:uncharacterized protein (TIGR03083 family)